jgi:16S rRNA (guanine1207-N2)-methyltransferase
MSGPPRPAAERDDPASDPGVLEPVPLCEFNAFRSVQRHGGCAVLPWKAQHLEATALGVETVPRGMQLPQAGFRQALVRVQKGRAGTYADLVAAWTALQGDGRLLVAGGNDVGIASWGRRLAEDTGHPVAVLANHSHARVLCVSRTAACPSSWVAGAGTSAGVFHQGGVDAGTRQLIHCLAQQPPAEKLLDLGCGAGHLGCAALGRWPQAQAWFLDADIRAVDAVAQTLATGVPEDARRCASIAWWDVSEPMPASGFDLILCNPPCHAGMANDLGIARAMFRAAVAVLRPGGRLLVVANRQLPYEADLARLGALSCLSQEGGFKILAVCQIRSQ